MRAHSVRAIALLIAILNTVAARLRAGANAPDTAGRALASTAITVLRDATSGITVALLARVNYSVAASTARNINIGSNLIAQNVISLVAPDFCFIRYLIIATGKGADGCL